MLSKIKYNLANIRNQNLIRKRILISKRLNNNIIINKKKYINFSSNDYLGLMQHPDILNTVKISLEKNGLGSSASMLISGFHDSHYRLEENFSAWLGFDKAILFNSGYLANLGVINTIANRNICIASDRLCHASILEGIKLSMAKNHRYKHCSISSLIRILQSKNPKIVITESIFSMEGTIAPIRKIINLSKKHDYQTIIDDAHGIGILGDKGRGICSYNNISQSDIGCLVIPLGKAFNAMGAIVAGGNNIIESIIQFSKEFKYTTSLPPAICDGINRTLSIISNDEWRRSALMEIIDFFNYLAAEKKISLVTKQTTPIRTIIIDDNSKVMKIQKALLEKGFLIGAVRPPTVPSARIRISLNCLHTKSQINSLLTHIYKYL
ncbi:MAG: aminotransferase class I/II-fold pyridoxal phosphate-dependent enzyme [Legionellales bacterium]|nr:aminotransferase class I/II-fold pyridoxal phosphate-dependent enzyme [Legionellales bacterium]